MENVADALTMASAALLFVLAFSLTMVLFSKAKETSDLMVEHLNVQEYLPKMGSVQNNVTREVGIETVVPTIYRYAQNDGSLQIRICDTDGSELQVFDANIDQQMNNISQNKGSSKSTNEIYVEKLNEKYNDENKQPYLFGAPWRGQGTDYTLERINAYIFSTGMKHLPKVKYSEDKTGHQGLKAYFSRRFEESYIEYRNKGNVYVDEYGEEINITESGTKIIITYKVKN